MITRIINNIIIIIIFIDGFIINIGEAPSIITIIRRYKVAIVNKIRRTY